MTKAYRAKTIEKKWQDHWEEKGIFHAKLDPAKPKYYSLIEFPYPSGEGLHVGHPLSNTAMDIISRKRRLEGYNVLFPIGWDAFGLPTENFAIKNKIHPQIVTDRNVANYTNQLKRLGYSFDWSREVNTTDPSYYKWTQWIFLKLLEHGLAYKAEMPVNWCLDCQVVLANEEVVDGVCERCGAQVVRRSKKQWMLAITKYAQKLLDGLDSVDFISQVKTQQRNWIGRSEGAEVDFQIKGSESKLRVFTTRPDTLFGATYMVVAPEHPVIDEYAHRLTNIDQVLAYRQLAAKKSEFERTELNTEKSGVELKGIKAINPVSKKEIPIWVSDYVMMTYGTGAIMAVPAHDTRDYEFATKFGLPIVEVVKGGDVARGAYTDTEDGIMVNSGLIDGLKVPNAKEKITRYLIEQGLGEPKVNYKLRDWVFARQRYWGEPIPVIWCDECGCVPLKETELPLVLPDIENYIPTTSGESPLATMEEWVNVPCPKCGGPAKRETDTMPQWAGSSWYFLRYTDPHNDEEFASQEALDYWLPVDWYNGGMEHTTLHLLYSRFWHLFLHDIGMVKAPEPYRKRTSHGMILGENNEKMSKSRGNVINPDDVVAEIGADAFRLYEMFMGAFDQPKPWSMEGAQGCRRFLERVWRLQDMIVGKGESEDLRPQLHGTIKKVSEDYERMKYNTAIASMMSFVNEVYAKGSITADELGTLLILLNPVAPHITEELWEVTGRQRHIYQQSWPVHDEGALVVNQVEIAIQVLGKVRSHIKVPVKATEEEVKELALADEKTQAAIAGKQLRRFIYIPGRLVNIVI